MRFHVLTLFPEMIRNAFSTSITGRALNAGILSLETVNIRDFAEEKRKGRVDDAPYGGGAGMVMQAEPVYQACRSVLSELKEPEKARVIYLSPEGRRFEQKVAEELSKEKELIFLCGHYEGIDERALQTLVTDEISLGDFVLTGGELAALVMMDTISRLLPGVLNNGDSALDESFMGDGLLEYPQYSRPEIWRGLKVPEILLSGNHGAVDRWRREQSLLRTAQKRPDLCSGAVLDKKDRKFITEAGLSAFYEGCRHAPKLRAQGEYAMIRNIIFDVGYVLVGYSWKQDFKRFGYDDEGVRRLADELFGEKIEGGARPMWERYDRGELTDGEIRDFCLEKYPEDREVLTWFFDHVSDWAMPLSDFADLIAPLKEKGYGVYLCSNYPETLWKKQVAVQDFYVQVDGEVVSFQEGFGKPEERFFRLLFDRYDLNPAECLFLDDRADNCLAAEKSGLSVLKVDTKKARSSAVKVLLGLSPLKEERDIIER